MPCIIVMINSDILENEVNPLFEKTCTLHDALELGDNLGIDVIAKCPKKSYAVRYKGWNPTMSNISSIHGYTEKYKKDYKESLVPVIFFVGKCARDYVEDFANELGVVLYHVRSRKHLGRSFASFLQE